MACYKVAVKVERELEFYVDAESKEEIVAFMEANPDWKPGDVDGLIDRVTDEVEVEYTVLPESAFVANFELDSGALREKS